MDAYQKYHWPCCRGVHLHDLGISCLDIRRLIKRLGFLFFLIHQVYSREGQEMKDDLEDYCLILLAIGGANFLGAFIQVKMVHNRFEIVVQGFALPRNTINGAVV